MDIFIIQMLQILNKMIKSKNKVNIIINHMIHPLICSDGFSPSKQ